MPRCGLSPLSFFCVRYARRRRFLSFSLSQVLGKTQTPFGVWDSPCVSPTWPRTMSSIRTPCSPSSPRFRTRSCVFFSFVAVVVRWYGCGWLRSVWSLFVWGCFSVRDHYDDYVLGFGVRADVPCVCLVLGHTESASPPPTPFLPNTVEYSPGRGWGT